MCGIAGQFRHEAPVSEGLLHELANAIKHRGPDDFGVSFSSDRRLGFAHRRLSILDVSQLGKQPMYSPSKRYTIVYNGEVYNFRSLQTKLKGLGHTFRSHSDTEVILTALDEWGIQATLPQLDGMFAAAVWDSKTRSVSLFRDRLGVKPLYYHLKPGQLTFCSELTRPLARISERKISANTLSRMLRFGYVPEPQTIYEDVHKVAAGQWVEIRESDLARGRSQIHTYWDTAEKVGEWKASAKQTSYSETVTETEQALRRSVQSRMVSDVPIGVFLSGGIDSTLMTLFMQQASTQPVRTFTIGFDSKQFNEAAHAKKISEFLGTEHTEFFVTEEDALRTIPYMPCTYGEPYADASQIPTYLLSKLASKHVKVALAGDGGDELFAGYAYYAKVLRAQAQLGRLPISSELIARAVSKKLTVSLLEKLAGPVFVSNLHQFLRTQVEKQRHIYYRKLDFHYTNVNQLVPQADGLDSYFPKFFENAAEQRMLEDLLHYLPGDILVKTDRASMAHSLEIRAPFVDDWKLLQLAWKLPLEHKLDPEGGKRVLKSVLANHIPRDLFDRPKQGFSIPMHQWFQGKLRDWVESLCHPTALGRHGHLDPQQVHLVKERAFSGDKRFCNVLWSICTFQMWHDEFHASASRQVQPLASGLEKATEIPYA